MKLGQRFGLYGGVFVLSAATVSLSIVLTRLYSAILGHHLAFLAISLALFGVGAGGMILTIAPSLARPPVLFARLAALSGLAGFAAIAAGIYLVSDRPIENLDREALGRVAILYLVSAAPFILSGSAIAASIQHARAEVGRLYLVDMIGAAVGGVGSILLLRFGAPRALLFSAVGMGLSSVLFMLGGREKNGPFSAGDRGAHPGVAFAFFLSTISALAGDVGAPWFKIESLRYVSLSKVQFQKWNELALVTVDRPVGGMAWMRMDGSAATAILDEKTRPPKHPDEMTYVLSGKEGPSLVIGAGGGRDVRAALAAGQTDVHAIEINRTIVNDVMLGEFRDFSKGLYARPDVHVEIADGRSYVRRSNLRFRNMVISLVDTWAAASVGGLALSENSLYTTEAFTDFINHLTDDGTLVVNRWDGEFERLLALGAAGLRSAGVTNPAAHMFSCSSERSTALLIKRTPLTQPEIDKLRGFCKRQFKEILAPDKPPSELRAAILADPAAPAARSTTSDLSAPTDDRPFFFYTVPPKMLSAAFKDTKKLGAEQQGLATLGLVLVASTALAFLCLLVPLAFRRRAVSKNLTVPRTERLRLAIFFGAIGLGFVLVEVSLVQHLTMFLGHPVYALSAVLTLLLSSTGVGAALVTRVPLLEANLSASRRAQILAILLMGLAIGLGPLLGALVGLPLPARIAITGLLLAPLGMLMGAQAPLGVTIAASRSPELVPWCWALNGFSSVIATSLGALLAMNTGFAFILIVAAVVYFVGSLALPRAWPAEDAR